MKTYRLLYIIILIFRNSNESFKLDGDLLKTMTKCKFNLGRSNLKYREIIREFAEEMNSDIGNIGRKSPRDRSIVELLKSPAIMDSGFSKISLSLDPKDFCDELKLLLQEKQAGNESDKIIEEIHAIIDNLLEYKCVTPTKHKNLYEKIILIHTIIFVLYNYTSSNMDNGIISIIPV